MTTLDDVIKLQKQYGVLVAPEVVPSDASSTPSVSVTRRTDSTVTVALTNTTGSSQIYAYITGLAINNNYAVFLLQSDGETAYYPSSPANTQTALAVDCSIAITGVGATREVQVPLLAGGRIWFSVDQPLTFLLNPGPGLVEPSVTNTTDPNYNISWDFCEFTYDTTQLFVNITYVDFVCLPIALSLTNTSGAVQTVPGLPSNGLSTVVSGMQAQDAKDGAGWGQLVVPTSSGGGVLRVLSPNSAITMNRSLFSTYWQSYVSSVWTKYTSETLTVDTQAQWGVVTGQVVSSTGELTFSSSGGSGSGGNSGGGAVIGAIPQPSSADVFANSTGAFAGFPDATAAVMGNICARVAAAFNRSTLLVDAQQPDGEVPSTYYQNAVTNHYARVVHAANLDGRGYAFPYDDVGPNGGADQKGAVADGSPQLLSVSVGGGGGGVSGRAVNLRDMARQGQQMPGGYRSAGKRLGRRDLLSWEQSVEEEGEKKALAGAAAVLDGVVTDLEKGELSTTADAGMVQVMSRPLQSLVPASVVQRANAWMQRLEQSPVYAYTKPVLDVLTRLLLAVLSLSVRTVLGRLGMVLAFVLLTVLFGLYGRVAHIGGGQ